MDSETEIKFVRMEGEMSVMRADLTATLEGFRKDMATRETRLLIYMISVVGIGIAILGAFIAILEFSSPDTAPSASLPASASTASQYPSQKLE